MANKRQLAIIRRGGEAWATWCAKHPHVWADLSGANLSGADLNGANLYGADLNGANLRAANLKGADLSGAGLRGADLRSADLRSADLEGAGLIGADLNVANLQRAKLSKADLSKANLVSADLWEADLDGANLSEAELGTASFGRANLRNANLSKADLSFAGFHWATLCGANLGAADLTWTTLSWANLNGARLDAADLSKAQLCETILSNLDLSTCKGLESCDHQGPSVINHCTLQRSGPLPLVFLQGIGLPDRLIDYLPSIFEQPIQLYSCFISYSSKDQAFAERLHADLQAKGVRCWFAPKDMKIGDRIGDTIDTAIRLRDKLLLILSEASMPSAWVTKEVRTALAEEEVDSGRTVLFPIRVDDAVMDTTEQWAHDIKRTRHIGDFTRWKEHDAYSKALERLLRDLRVEKG